MRTQAYHPLWAGRKAEKSPWFGELTRCCGCFPWPAPEASARRHPRPVLGLASAENSAQSMSASGETEGSASISVVRGAAVRCSVFQQRSKRLGARATVVNSPPGAPRRFAPSDSLANKRLIVRPFFARRGSAAGSATMPWGNTVRRQRHFPPAPLVTQARLTRPAWLLRLLRPHAT